MLFLQYRIESNIIQSRGEKHQTLQFIFKILHIIEKMFGNINSETPRYEVIAKKNGYEILRYNKLVLAQTTYEVPKKNTDFSSKTSSGFWPLFNYISGHNTENTKISMTAPVIMQEYDNGSSVKRTMSFIMSPSRFNSISELPQAND
jgi:hypothetical protein